MQFAGTKGLSANGKRRYASVMLNTALSLMMLTIIALVLGAIYLLRKGGAQKQALLMLFLALVLGVNIGIWTLPDDSGKAPVDQAK